MPMRCHLPIRSLSTEAFGDLDYRIMRHCFDSQNELGRLADESVYQRDIAIRLLDAGFQVQREVEVTASFDNYVKSFFLDVVVADWGVYEFKSVASLKPEHETQLLNYLRMLDIAHGKLVNFRSESVKAQFVNNDRPHSQRIVFEVDSSLYHGPSRLKVLVEALLRDWGSGLTLVMYQEAICNLLGDEADALRLIPMRRQNNELGNQRFLMHTENRAWRITAFPSPSPHYRIQLRKLLAHSELAAIDWINVGLDRLTFNTATKND